ncbi:baseplate J/gp47 family protein [Nocardia sp. NPDC049149]|uniref:baseplate J/gp47 family protein n=1 Tax=Nocardia sp. NPDC049149 TaxID=3364315 RepID=UPI0037190267
MTQYGVTKDGFVLKGFTEILKSAQQRALDAFGPDIDLAGTSVLTKLLQATADEDAMLWQRLEDVYYSQFASTASGQALNMLGEDIGLPRNYLFAEGDAELKIVCAVPGVPYLLPEGTVVLDKYAAPYTTAFFTTAPVKLTFEAPTATVRVRAFRPGVDSEIGPDRLAQVDPEYLHTELGFATSVTVTATNRDAITGGGRQEDDNSYRARQLGFPRDMWTLQSARAAVLRVRGVTDVLLSDPLGGVDTTQSFYDTFNFGDRSFSADRRFGEPYFFDVVVAHELARPWRTTGTVTGIYEQVKAQVDRVRPIGIYPNIIRANHVDVGVRATLVVERGQDPNSVRAAALDRLSNSLDTLRLGSDVVFSQVMRLLVEQTSVVDVRDLRLRRYPADATDAATSAAPIEIGFGENLVLGPTEIGQFRQNSRLIDIQVVDR